MYCAELKKKPALVLCVACFVVSMNAALAREPVKSEKSNTQQPKVGLERKKQHAAEKALKYCEGKYVHKEEPRSEQIISVECSSATATCECATTGVTCGESSIARPLGTEFVTGSCKTTIVPN